MMTIQESYDDHSHTVYLSGVLNETTAGKLEAYILDADETAFSKRWVLDCAGLEKMTASALRVLIIAFRRVMAAQGSGVMRGCNSGICTFLRTAGFDMILPGEC